MQFYANTFAQAAIAEGKAVGVGVGVAYNNEVVHTNAFGLADAKSGTAFTTDTKFEIASSTKVFTTNLLGQWVYNGWLSLSNRLSQFSSALGTLKPLTGEVTLEELADFTGGFPRYAPLCKNNPKVLGCIPSFQPTTAQYTAEDFLEYFQNVPENYDKKPPTVVSKLPAPCSYSNFAIGLLGLPLPDQMQINEASLLGWFMQSTTKS